MSKLILKFLILTESAGNPRSFPERDVTQLEETYPYLIRQEFKESTFWQLSYGNITTEQLCSQATSYLNHWEPDVIIMHTGLNDCRPEAFTELQKTIINKLPVRLFGRLKKYLYHPSLIKLRQVTRVTKPSFQKTLTKFRLIFPQSIIYWLEICAGHNYKESRPGVIKKMEDYNKIIEKVYEDQFVKVKEAIENINGFNVDNLHWNKQGHKAVAEILLPRIQTDLKTNR